MLLRLLSIPLCYMSTFLKFIVIAAVFGGGWGVLYLIVKALT